MFKFENITYGHEHPIIDLSKGKNNPDCLLNCYKECLDELKDLYAKGVRRWVDCSNHGIGVDWSINDKIAEETGIEIIRSTGFYKTPFMPDYVKDADIEQLANIMRKDLELGAQMIGEIGTSHNEWTDEERKVFQAAVKVHHETGTVILTHTTLGTLIREQVQFFKENGVNPNKVIISHVALSDSMEDILFALENGFNVGFDTIGKLNYLSDEKRAQFIKSAIEHGYVGQLLMSMDITRVSNLRKNGGVGYNYLLDTFIPLLIEIGVSVDDVETILCKNFERIMGYTK